MGKKLLSILFLFFAFFLNTSLGFGQDCTGTSVIITSSATDNKICAGETVTFTASPTNAGANPTYQWRVNGVNQSGNGATFTTSTLQNNHSVTVVMNPNCNGAPNVTSSSIATTVNPKPTVTSANTATVCSGAGPNISLNATTPSTFTWSIGTITGSITGASNGSGTTIDQPLTNPSNSTVGTVQYIVTPTSTAGSCSGSPYTITVTVNPTPSVTTANTATICSGAGPNISLTASAPSSFSWTIGTITGGITGASNGSGATINQTLTNPSNSTAGTVQYIVTPTATTGGCAGTPQTITVTVNPKPSVTSANTATICSGAGPNISLTASTPSSFSWTIGTITGGITGAIAGSGTTINQTLTNPSSSTAGTVQYIATPTATTGGCIGTPQTITVTINPKPSVTSANTATICSGAGPNIALTASTPSSFAWTVGTITGSITGASVGTGTSINQTLTNPSNSTAGTVQYIVTPTATTGGCQGSPYTITVTVNPTPSVTTAATATVCSGVNPNISLTASAPSSFSWTVGTITGGITGASGGSGATINQTLTNPSNSTSGTVHYIVTPTATTGSCAGTPYTITVTVNPKPIVTTANTAIVCSGFGPNIALAASTPSSFSWTIGTITGGITGASAASGATINQTLNNPSNSAAGTVQYIVTPTATAGSCSGTPYTITVTVNPTLIPSVSITSTTTAICTTAPSGSTPVTFTATPTNGGTNPTYQWKNNGNNISGQTGATYTANSLPNGSQISVEMTSNATCAAPQTVTSSNSIIMKGYTPPAVPVFSPAPSESGSVNPTLLCPPNTGLVYTVASDPNVTSYNWTLPAGWVITGGAGTNSITINNSNLNAGTYNLVATARNACGSSSTTLPVIINTAASVYAGADASICKGGNYTISDAEYSGYINSSGNNAPTWTVSPSGSGTFSNIKEKRPTFTPGNTFTGTITLTLTSTKTTNNFNCSQLSDQMVLTVNAPPAITAHPSTTAQPLCLNAAATPLTVTATGAGLTYQWYSNITNSNTGGTSLVAAATSATYTPLTTTAGTLYYYAVVSGTCASPVKSNVSGAVTVNALPAITAQPSTTSQTLCPGAAATQLSVTATGAGLSYQWYSNTINSNTGGTLINNATTSTFTPVTTTVGTLYYYVIVSGTCTPAVTSSVSGAITINSPPAITTQPSTTEQTLCPNAAANQLSVTATGAGLTYQWHSNTTNSNSGGTSLGASATSSTYTPLTATAGTSYYYVVVSGSCSPSVTSAVSGAVNVNAPPAITAQPSTTEQTLCLDAAATTLSVTATGAGLTYQWYSNTTNSNTGGTLITNATSATYTPVTTTAGTLYYYVVVSGTCTPAVNSNVSGAVIVNAPPAITVQPSITDQTLCPGAASTPLSVTVTGAGLTFQWYSNTNNSNSGGTSLGAGATSSTYSPLTTTAGTLYYYVVVSGTCTPIITSAVSGAVIINALPEITSQPSTAQQTLCLSETASALSVTATGAGLTYQWYSNPTNSNSGGTIISGATTSTYTPLTATAGTLYYYVVVSGTCTPAVSSAVSGAVIVNEPVAITTQPEPSQTVCSGFPVSFSVSATGTGLTYQWQFNGSNIPGETNSTYNISQAGLSNSGNYKVIVKGTAPCSNVTSEGANLVVNESITISSQPIAAEACEGNSASFTVEATGTGLTYQWRKNNIPISGATDETLTINNLLLADAGNYDVVISGTDDICSQIISNPATLTVTPTVTINPFTAATSIQCQGAGTVTTTTTANNATGITYSLDAASLAGGNTIVAATGAVTYSANWSGTTTITASAAGCNGPATTTHVVTVTPIVTINAFTAATSARCQGAGSVTTTTTANNATGITYSLDAASLAGGNTIVAATGAVTYSANWSGTTTITASAAGCNGPATTTHVVTVTPTVTINPFTSATSTRCQGAGSVTTTTTANNATGITYSLDAASLAGGNTIVAATGAVTYSANWSGTTTITASAAGCNGPATTTHVVTVTPTVTINPFTAATSTRCQGAGSVTTTTTANNATGITYSLDAASLASGNTIVAATGAVTYSANWSGTTTITASAAGCNGPATTTHVVTVTPTVTINPFTSATSTRCQGAGSVTTTTTANNATGITYSLDAASLAGGNTIVAATGAVTYSANWSGTTTITASAAGCNGPATTTHVVTVTPTVAINAFTAATSTRCQGAGSVTTTTTANNATGISYSLDAASLAGGNTIVAATGAVTYSANWSGTTTITASAAGCNGPATTTHVVTVTPTVTINPFTAATSTRCQGAGSVTTTTTANNATGITYSLDAASLAGGNTIVAATGAVTYSANWSGTTTITASAAGCNGPVTTTHVVTVDSLPIGGTLAFEGVGRVFITCENAVDGYASKLILTGMTGQVVEWQYRTASATDWSTYNSQNTQLNSGEVEDLVNNVSTIIRAKISNGACVNNTYSATAIVSVIPSNIKPSPVKAEPLIVCFGDDITLSSETGYNSSISYFEGGDFTSAGIKNNGWNFTDPNGNEVPFDASANSGTPAHWHKTQPKWKFETAAINDPYTLTDMWWNPLDDGKQNEHFAITQGNFDSNMDTPAFNLTGMDEGKVTFDQAFNLTTGATIRVILLKNGTELKELYKITGPASSGNYHRFGNGTPNVNQMSLDLGSYIGETGLKIRFEYRGVRPGDVWAVDNIKVPEGPQGVLLQWFYDDNPGDTTVEQIGVDNQEVVSFTPRKIGWNDFEVKTALLLDSNGDACESLDNFERVRVFVFDTYETTVEVITGDCGYFSAVLNASVEGALQGPIQDPSAVTFDGYRGEWKIVGPSGINYTLTNQDGTTAENPLYNPKVVFEAESLAEFIITWELIPTETYPEDYPVVELRGQLVINPECPPVSTPVTPAFSNCTTLDFDGTDDVVVIDNDFSGVKAVEAWIRPELSGRTIISGPSFEIQTPADVNVNGRWYHIAVIYDGEDAGLYIDGLRKGNAPSGNGGGTRTSIGAKWTSADTEATNHFSGWIEEVRIWKNSPTLKEIRFMMNQRFKLTGDGADAKVVNPLEGEIVPNKPVAGSYYTFDGYNLDENGDAFYNQTAAELYAYYRLISDVPDPTLGIIANTYKPIGGNTPDLSLSGIPGRLYNMTTHQENTSPTPYFTGNGGGDWDTQNTWARPVWNIPNTSGMVWNIVKLSDPITSSRSLEILGINSIEDTFTMVGTNPESHSGGGTGNELKITHYLNLDGNIDLNGESQLVQDHGSILAEASKGYLERDQQGKRNSFVYNYWSSPVSLTGSAPNNASYNVKEVLMDGTDPVNPAIITFKPEHWAADNARTTPITISTYWLWGFSPAEANVYAEWDHIRETGSLKTGEGFTMKGTDGVIEGVELAQNYTFRGKPHNGDITTDPTFGVYENYLIGNPYPSAIDTKQFILDNLKNISDEELGAGRNIKNVFDGSLYFWDHIAELNHILKDYVGGYAVRNILAGVPAVSVDLRINPNNAQSGKVPGRYLPVGQGFLINSSQPEGSITISGGEIFFKNSQRVFRTDGDGSLFLRPEVVTKKSHEKSEDVPKIRLSFTSPVGYYRQILVGAVPHTTNGFDLGYDAPLMDNNIEDMYWLQGTNQLVIQGVPNFNRDQVLPLGIKVEGEKEFTIQIDTVENSYQNLNIYLKDKLNDTIHNLRESVYVSTSEPGYINDRFEIVFFKDEPPVVDPGEEFPGGEFVNLTITHAHDLRQIRIINPEEMSITGVYLFDLNGNLIDSYGNLPVEKEIKLNVASYATGVYLVRVYAEGKIITKKIIISN